MYICLARSSLMGQSPQGSKVVSSESSSPTTNTCPKPRHTPLFSKADMLCKPSLQSPRYHHSVAPQAVLPRLRLDQDFAAKVTVVSLESQQSPRPARLSSPSCSGQGP